MGVLTWQNVAAPDLNVGQEGYRNAAALFDRAAQQAHGAIAEKAAMDEAEKAARQKAADNLLTQQLLSAKTPGDFEKMTPGVLGDGSQVIPSEFISPEMRLRFDARKDFLTKQDRENQVFGEEQKQWTENALTRAFAAKTRDQQISKWDEEHAHNDQMKLAGPIYSQFTDLAQNDPSKAMAKFREAATNAGIKLNLKDEEDVAAKYHALRVAPDYAKFSYFHQLKLDKEQEQAADLAFKMQKAGEGTGAAAEIAKLRETAPSGKVRSLAEHLVMGMDKTFAPRFLTNSATQDFQPTPGEGPDINGRTPKDIAAADDLAFSQAENDLGPYGKIISDNDNVGRKGLTPTMAAFAIAKDFKKATGKAADPELIQTKIQEAMKRGLSAGEAASAVDLASKHDGTEWFTADTSLGGNLAINDDAFEKAVAGVQGARAEYNKFKTSIVPQHTSVQNLVEQAKPAADAAQLQEARRVIYPNPARALGVNEAKTRAQYIENKLSKTTKTPIPGTPAPAAPAPAPVTAKSFYQPGGDPEVQRKTMAASWKPVKPLANQDAQDRFELAQELFAKNPNDPRVKELIGQIGGIQ